MFSNIKISFVLTVDSINNLKESLDSFFSQSFKDFEIFCINNTTEDISTFVNVYKSDERFQFIDSDDKICFLKNRCIQESSGEYICFLTSDNILTNECILEQISKQFKENSSNIISYNMQLDYINSVTSICLENFRPFNYEYVELKETKKYENPLYLSRNIFKTNFLLENDIKFEDIPGEDIVFLIRTLIESSSFLCNPTILCRMKIDFNEKLSSEHIIGYVKCFRRILTILSCENRFDDLLYCLSENLIELKNIDASVFQYTSFKELEFEISSLINVLTIHDYSFSFKNKRILRYIHNNIYNKHHDFDVMISVIIPTYNVEDYLDDCLMSLLNQTFEDFEVIIVDDSSTDSTVEIIKYYEKLDSRIRFIEKKRKSGSGGSRNYGMKFARGKYIKFLDADDWIDSNTLEELFYYAEKFETDMVFFKFMNYDEEEKHFFLKPPYYTLSVLDPVVNSVFNIDDVDNVLFRIPVTPVNKLYSRVFLESINALFPEDYIHQDNPFFFQVFCEAEKVFLLDKYFYNRRHRSNSISTLRDGTQIGTIEIVEYILNVFINNTLYEKYKKGLLNRLITKLKSRINDVGDEFKPEYYIKMRSKLFKFMYEYGLKNDFEENLYEVLRKYFENVIYSKNYEEFLEKTSER